MKQLFTLLLSFLAIPMFFCTGKAQYIPPMPLIYGASAFQDSLWAIDTSGGNWTVVRRLGPSIPGFTITGINGLAFDPCGYKTYAILKLSGVTGRVLATIDLETAVCTQVGNLGDNFSSISFNNSGQLFGVTGDGATVPETFYSINKTDASKTLVSALGNGNDGEVICYNEASDKFYHWSGNGTVVFEKIKYTAPVGITPITTGGAFGETFGALYLAPNKFLISNISSNFRMLDTLGNYGPILINLPDDCRGLVMPPRFSINNDTICQNAALQVGAAAVISHDIYYSWGDGVIDTVTNGTGATHEYASTGNFTLNILLDNGICSDTIFTSPIRVLPIPIVTLSGNTGICPGGSVLLTGSSGGTSQWYLNGTLIIGANSNTYSTNLPGVYNMVKTNLNGCADSAAVGLTVINVQNPTVNLGADNDFCGSATLDAQNAGASYLWNDGTTTQTINTTLSGPIYVVVTDSNNCSASDTVNIVVNPVPTVTYSEANNFACTYSGLVALTPGSPAGGSYAGTAVSGTNFNPATAGVGSYTVTYSFTDANGCTNSTSSQITVSACASINESNALAPLQAYPNPSNGLFTIKMSDLSWVGATLKVIDVTGKVAYQTSVAQDQITVDLTAASSGIYQLSIQLDTRNFATQIIKK